MSRKYRKYTEVLDEMLQDPQFAAEFLSDALQEEDFETFLMSLRDVVRVHGSISSVAKESQISRGTLYNLFSENKNPKIQTLLALLHYLGYELKVTRKRSKHAA